jgi:general secretion pathway protein G
VTRQVSLLADHQRRLSPARSNQGASAYQSNSTGFTLLELLVVVAIIGLLAAFVGPKVLSNLGKSETTVARAQMEAFVKALDIYRIDVGRYPDSQQGLAALVTAPANEPKWRGPYLANAVPNDPWGRPYIYSSPGAIREFEIQSYGKDGVTGGDGENADIFR